MKTIENSMPVINVLALMTVTCLQSSSGNYMGALGWALAAIWVILAEWSHNQFMECLSVTDDALALAKRSQETAMEASQALKKYTKTAPEGLN